MKETGEIRALRKSESIKQTLFKKNLKWIITEEYNINYWIQVKMFQVSSCNYFGFDMFYDGQKVLMEKITKFTQTLGTINNINRFHKR